MVRGEWSGPFPGLFPADGQEVRKRMQQGAVIPNGLTRQQGRPSRATTHPSHGRRIHSARFSNRFRSELTLTRPPFPLECPPPHRLHLLHFLTLNDV